MRIHDEAVVAAVQLSIRYLPLNNWNIERICRLVLGRMEKNLNSRYGASLSVDHAVIRQLVQWNTNHPVQAWYRIHSRGGEC